MEGRDLPVDSQDQQHGVLGHGHGVGAAVLADRDMGLAGPGDVDGVVAGAQDLHELEPLGAGIGFIRQKPEKANQILGIPHGGRDFLGLGRGRERAERKLRRLQGLGQRLDVWRHLDALSKHDRFLCHDPPSMRRSLRGHLGAHPLLLVGPDTVAGAPPRQASATRRLATRECRHTDLPRSSPSACSIPLTGGDGASRLPP